jgi:Icc-related predicted phosphoesterase
MIIDIISDLHGHFPELDGGDLLLVCGDLTARHTESEYEEFILWLGKQDYKKKVFISGNHDNLAMSKFDCYDAEYLLDSGTEYAGMKIWGSPWTKTFQGANPKCTAFTVDTEVKLSKKWDKIPDDTDILITHSPPYGILDKSEEGEYLGSHTLRNQVMSRIKPKIHCFGHIHTHGGKKFDSMTTKFVNASIMNDHYKPVNKPVRIIL